MVGIFVGSVTAFWMTVAIFAVWLLNWSIWVIPIGGAIACAAAFYALALCKIAAKGSR